MMQVRVLTFGVMKDLMGRSEATVELPAGATVADLLASLRGPQPAPLWRAIAVSVNSTYATPSQVLAQGDEVGLLPPVSGGAEDSAGDSEDLTVIALTREAISAEKLVADAKHGEDGAVVVFDGIVRNHTRGRKTLYLDYEAYEEMAVKQMGELAREARTRFSVRKVTIVHRLGRLGVGETSVLIVVASAHRAHAYEASRWLIDTLKKIVPIWKRETFVDGVVWAAGEPFPVEIAATPPEAQDGA